MSYLITLAIGPVQSYISQARRTQDLWQGSRILSYLASKGVHHAMKQTGADIIYPKIGRSQTDNIPNRLVVLWQGDEAGARQCAGEMEGAIRDAWKTLSRNTMTYFIKSLDTAQQSSVRHIWERQEENWLECYWVVTPYQDNHTESIRAANAAMGSRKLLRTFPQMEEGGRKCSITGEHEALHHAGDYVGFWNARRAEQRNLSLIGQHERLSAISTIKRFAHEKGAGNTDLKIEDRYPSTSSIAAVTFKYDVLKALDQGNPELWDALENFIRSLQKLCKNPDDLFFQKDKAYNPEKFPFITQNISRATLDSDLAKQFMSIDGDFLFDDTLIARTIEEYTNQSPSKTDLTKAQRALACLLRKASASSPGIAKPEPYFVILSMDGDNMGKTLGNLTREQHATFSETLADFARNDVPRIIEGENPGRVVYAGGDDVLALLPVRDALKVADALRNAFQLKIAGKSITNHEGKPLTASTGLAFVHRTHNLQGAVNAANDAQKVAKDRLGRNALSIEFLRRSGEPRSMGGKWEHNGVALIAQITMLIQAFGQGLSRNLPYDVGQIAYSMGRNVPETAVKAELTRVLKRRTTAGGNAEELAEIIISLQKANGWESTIGWIELARFVAQRTEGDGA